LKDYNRWYVYALVFLPALPASFTRRFWFASSPSRRFT